MSRQTAEIKRVRPQPGPQEQFLSSPADIVIYGGAAGGGKSWGLLLEPIRHVTKNNDFSAVFFRRNTKQVTNPGGLWDESIKLYPLASGIPLRTRLTWKWPKGGKIVFAHLEYDTTVLEWQGAQVPLICFDELTHFSRNQFFYMLSRNRSLCGIRPYVRATCNPDADSWVADLIAWWIDQGTGFAIPERSGVIRWFIVINDKVIWGDSKEELVEKYGTPDGSEQERIEPKSLTFIHASVFDNKELLAKDPGYLANLKALPLVDQARLLGGNWKIRPAAGLMFRREWCEVIDAAPANLNAVRYWDLAATEKTDANDPDWTVGWKMGRDSKTGLYHVLHVTRFRHSPHKTEEIWKNTASQDGVTVRQGFPQDPGQAGKTQAAYIVNQLSGLNVTTRPERGNKIIRFGPFSAQCQAGNVKFLRGPWNEEVFNALEGFPDATHDDDADAAGGAFGMLTNSGFGLLDYYQQKAQEIEEQKKAAAAGR